MDKLKQAYVFSTQNVDLASFLVLEGIKFMGCELSPEDPRVVVLNFLDEKQNCLDLERVFFSSEFKKYRDINKWLLSKVHGALRNR